MSSDSMGYALIGTMFVVGLLCNIKEFVGAGIGFLVIYFLLIKEAR